MMRRILRGGIAAAGLAVAVSVTTVPAGAQQAGARGAAAQSVPTPRTADGKPDLSGRWVAGGGGGGGRGRQQDASGNIQVVGRYRKNNPTNGERDAGLMQRRSNNQPLYKPEYWEKVQYLDENGNKEDSNFHCAPAGVPRMGPPNKIVQTPTEVIFMYNQKNTYRIVPVDGRPHDPINADDQTFMGDSIGRWDGDTLVVDVVGFNEMSWLGWPGYFHTNRLRVEERLRREGNTLHYQATAFDDDVLMEPWTLDPRVLRLDPTPRPQIEDPHCIESDSENLVTRERG